MKVVLQATPLARSGWRDSMPGVTVTRQDVTARPGPDYGGAARRCDKAYRESELNETDRSQSLLGMPPAKAPCVNGHHTLSMKRAWANRLPASTKKYNIRVAPQGPWRCTAMQVD